jgi:hypothetical protein
MVRYRCALCLALHDAVDVCIASCGVPPRQLNICRGCVSAGVVAFARAQRATREAYDAKPDPTDREGA